MSCLQEQSAIEERTREGQGKSKCFVFVTGKVPTMGLPQLSFHGTNKALIFNSQHYSCISWVFPCLGTLERGWLCADPVEDKRDFCVPWYLLSFRSSSPAVTGNTGKWMATTFRGGGVQRQADSVLEWGGGISHRCCCSSARNEMLKTFP